LRPRHSSGAITLACVRFIKKCRHVSNFRFLLSSRMSSMTLSPVNFDLLH